MAMRTIFMHSRLIGMGSAFMFVASACSNDTALIGGDRDPVRNDAGDTGGASGATGTGGSKPGASGAEPGTGGGGSGAGGAMVPGSGGAPASGSGGAAGGGGADICSLPISSGPCLAYAELWGYDPAIEDCKKFIYGGCQGNANAFPSRVACMARCSDACAPQDARDVGSCEPLRGFRWDGKACVIVSGCSCEGVDCAHLAPTREQCEADHADCSADAQCSDAKKAVLDFVAANKECTTTADCKTVFAGCGVTEAGCTGQLYVNKDTPNDQLQSLRAALGDCLGATCDGPVCAALPPPAACIDGRCRGGSF
jgi:hypothetical protein